MPKLILALLFFAVTSFAHCPPGPRPGPRPGPGPGPGPAPAIPVPIPGLGNSQNSGGQSSENDNAKYRKELFMSILGMVATAQKPDKKVLGDLVNTLASLSRDGHISDREMTQLKVYLKRVLKSSKVNNSEITELERQVENAANEAGMNSDQRKMLVSRMSAVARSLQEKQRQK